MDQNPQTAYNPNKITKLDFNKKYWFTSLQMVEVINPTAEDYPFMVEMRHFIVKAGANERLPGVIANVYLDQMSKILAQGDDKLAFMADPQLMKIYFDKLIVDVESLIPEINNVPAYLRDVPTTAVGAATDDVPPWQRDMESARSITPDNVPDPRIAALEAANAEQAALLAQMAEKLGITTGSALVTNEPISEPILEKATEIAPNSLVTAPNVPEPSTIASEPTEKEFEYQDNKYKMVIDKNGKQMFFKNGRQTSEAEYAKSASML